MKSLLLFVLIWMVDFGINLLVSNWCVSGFFICICIVCLSGCVLNIGLKFVLVNLFIVVVDRVSLYFFFVSLVWSEVSWILVIDLICFFFNGWNIIILFMWLMNFGLKCCFIIFIIDVFILLYWFLLCLFWMIFEFKLDVMIIMVFLKFIVCFCLLVNWLLFSIWSRILNIFGCVFLILFNKMIEYGLWCIVLVK